MFPQVLLMGRLARPILYRSLFKSVALLTAALVLVVPGCASQPRNQRGSTPTSQEPGVSPPGRQSAGRHEAAPGGQQTDTDELRRIIEQKLEQARKEAATRPAISPTVRTSPTPPRDVPPTVGQVSYEPTQVTPGEELSATRAGPAASQPAASQPTRAGCGAQEESINLTPPPPDQPQPKFVCENETLEIGPIWRGQPAKFVFKIKNEGEGVLNILARRG